jgi:hypothetical protein
LLLLLLLDFLYNFTPVNIGRCLICSLIVLHLFDTSPASFDMSDVHAAVLLNMQAYWRCYVMSIVFLNDVSKGRNIFLFRSKQSWRNTPQPICLIVVCVFVVSPFSSTVPQSQIPEHNDISSHSNLYTRSTDCLVISQSPAYCVSTTRNTSGLRLWGFSPHKIHDKFHRHLSYTTR